MGKDNPLVSILMTSYNSSKFIEEAILSIIEQTYENWELLIADDCSVDNTRELINKFTDVRIKQYHNDTNLHYLRTRNRLLNYVSGEFITLLDADDIADPERLEIQLSAFKKDSDLVLCGTHVKYIDVNGKPLDIKDSKPLTYEQIKSFIKDENVFTGSTIMVKTRVWKEFGGYRDYFSSLGYEDYDLTSRIVEHYKAINVPDELYTYRQYPNSTSKKDLLYNPFKLHGYTLIQKFIEQREKEGRDYLENNDIPGIINFIVEKNKPYIDDQSLIYRNLMWSYLRRKMHLRALKSILKAIQIKPLIFSNWKTLIIFVLIKLYIIKE